MEPNEKDKKEEVKKKSCCGEKRQALTRRQFIEATAVTAGAAAAAGFLGHEMLETAAAAPPKLNTPTITCVGETQHTIFLQVCAGASGAPAGFSVQWVKHSAYPALTCGASQDALWPASSDANLCKASFSGTPGCSAFNLAPNTCITVEIGNVDDSICGVGPENCGAAELDCGTEYVFHAFAHNVPGGAKKSDLTANLCCTTESCVSGCVLTQGYWKTHPCEWPAPFVPGTPDPTDLNGNKIPDNMEGQCARTKNPNEQCPCDATNTLTIGSLAYTQCQLLCSLDQPGEGNALVILAHQLIATKLNMLNGASAPDCDISAADALISGTNILSGSVGPFSTLGQQMIAIANCLDLYNNGDGAVPHCA